MSKHTLHQKTFFFFYPKVLDRSKLPLEVSVKCTNVYPSWDINTLSEIIDVFQWTLDTVEDGTHDTRP